MSSHKFFQSASVLPARFWSLSNVSKLSFEFGKCHNLSSKIGRHYSVYGHIKSQPLDAIKQLTIEFQKDPFKDKILLGEGVYKDDNGKSFILPSVKKAEEILFAKGLDHEYAPVGGVPSFCVVARNFALGKDSSVLSNTATVQTISGTGALNVAGAFLNRFFNGKPLFVPNPTWLNHNKIFGDFGISVQSYRYFDRKTGGMDVDGCLQDIKNAPRGSIILLHACAHNPTGVDPSRDTWKQISKICKEREHIILFDSAYQGFASGDPERDAWSFRYFIEDGHKPLICQSFSKNFGLYGERVGALQVVCDNAEEANAVHSQLMVLIRAMYSNPPLYGARLVTTVFEDAALTKQWHQDVITMSSRIASMRKGLVGRLENLGSSRDWKHITSQIGMFAYSGLNEVQVEKLKKEYHIYMTKDGRISISGLTTSNLDSVASAIHNVTK